MIIGTNGQWKASIIIDGTEVPREGFDTLLIVEEVGNLLPTLEIKFKTDDEQLLRVSGKASKVNVKIFSDTDEVGGVFKVTKTEINPVYDKTNEVRVVGILDKMKYTLEERNQSFSKKKSYEVVKKLMEDNGFKKDKYLDETDDKQTWLQHSTSDKKYLNNVNKKAYKKGTFFSTAINSDGTYNFIDVVKHFKDERDIRTMGPESIYDVTYAQVVNIYNNTSYLKATSSAGMKQSYYNQKTGESGDVEPDIETQVGADEDTEPETYKRGSSTMNISGDEHPNVVKAFANHRTGSANFSLYQVHISLGNKLVKIRLFDLFKVVLPKANAKTPFSNEAMSGKYFVTKNIFFIQKNILTHSIILNRDGINKSH
jgi:hypothetical protein